MSALNRWKKAHGVDYPALFPSSSNRSKDRYLCSNSIRQNVKVVAKDIDLEDFYMRMLRMTTGQRMKNRGVPDDVASTFMGNDLSIFRNAYGIAPPEVLNAVLEKHMMDEPDEGSNC